MTISYWTILLFFVYIWGLGYGAVYFLKKPENFFERNLLRLGLGLAVFPILAVLINFLRIPLDWKLFLGLSLVFPAYELYKIISENRLDQQLKAIKSWRPTKSDLYLMGVILIFVISIYVYAGGAFSYPYLEDEDPWGHSEGMKFVALEKSAYDPDFAIKGGKDIVLSYMDPYPPGYDVLIGVLHQTSPDLNWTMKFFNALIISLGLIFFYLFVKQLIADRGKALMATFVLAAVPCYLSHFIWAHSLIITIFFPTMYAFLMIREEKKWAWLAMILVASIWVTQNFSQPMKLTAMILIYLVVLSITYNKLAKEGFLALFGGMALSFIWWGAMLYRWGISAFFGYYGVSASSAGVVSAGANAEVGDGGVSVIEMGSKLFVKLMRVLFDPGGSGARAYTFDDFFVAKGQNMINNPIGIGIVVSILAGVGLLILFYKYRKNIVLKENFPWCLTIAWLIYTFWAVNGMTFPISIARDSFRSWMILAIPIAILAVEGIYFAKGLFRQNKILEKGILILLIMGIIFTSFDQKYELNNAVWPTSSGFANPQEAAEYGAWFGSVPDNSKVFLYAPRPKIVVGFGKYSCNWCEEEINFRKDLLNKSSDDLHNFLKQRNYEYLVLSPRMDYAQYAKKYGEEWTKETLQKRYDEILSSGKYALAYQKENVLIALKVR